MSCQATLPRDVGSFFICYILLYEILLLLDSYQVWGNTDSSHCKCIFKNYVGWYLLYVEYAFVTNIKVYILSTCLLFWFSLKTLDSLL